jgi:Transglycosylase SLT domain
MSNGTTTTPVKGTGAPGAADSSDIEDSFFPALTAASTQLGCVPGDLLGIMMAESNVRPDIRNTNGGATGLIQFMPATLKGLGWPETPDAFAKLSATDQMPYVVKYLSPGKGKFTSAGRLYQFVFLPGTMNKATQPGDAICSKDDSNTTLAKAYAANAGLDANKDGKITIAELTARVTSQQGGARWKALFARLQSATAPGASGTSSGPAAAPTGGSSSGSSGGSTGGGANGGGANGGGTAGTAPDAGTADSPTTNPGAARDAGPSTDAAASSDAGMAGTAADAGASDAGAAATTEPGATADAGITGSGPAADSTTPATGTGAGATADAGASDAGAPATTEPGTAADPGTTGSGPAGDAGPSTDAAASSDAGMAGTAADAGASDAGAAATTDPGAAADPGITGSGPAADSTTPATGTGAGATDGGSTDGGS